MEMKLIIFITSFKLHKINIFDPRSLLEKLFEETIASYYSAFNHIKSFKLMSTYTINKII
jgi:hypothetical protein